MGNPWRCVWTFLLLPWLNWGTSPKEGFYRLISGSRGLPSFLVANPGLNSGFMIPQYTAASIVSQNKQYCTPASVDSIESSQGQEDHVSMGANAAVKLHKVILNIQRLLAIELLNANQAMFFREKDKTSPVLKNLMDNLGNSIDFIENDKVMYVEIAKALDFIQQQDPLNYM
jgi:histidine ammonia-lyase